MIGPTSGLPPVGSPMQTYFQPHTAAVSRQTEGRETTVQQHHDSASFSPAPAGEGAFRKELISRVSRDVRTATTTGDIRALQQAVSAGTYTPDPAAIAGRMLALAGGRG